MCTSWDIHSGSWSPCLIFHPPWRRPVITFVPLCCSMQKICGFGWDFTYIPSPMSGLSLSGFTSAILFSGWTRIELCTRRCGVSIRSGDFSILKNKRSNVKFASKCDLRPLIQWSPSLPHFHQNNYPHHLHFRWHKSKTGWTISQIATSFHQALMALGIRQSAMENSDGQLRYAWKTRGCSFGTPLFEG